MNSSFDMFLPQTKTIPKRRKMRKLAYFFMMGCALFVFLIAVSSWFLIHDLDLSSNDEMIISSGFMHDPSRNDQTYRILLVGDTGGIPILETTWAQREVKSTMSMMASEKDVQLIINVGDNIYFTGPTDEFDPRFETRFENVYDTPSLQVPWLMIAGNHDHFGNVTAEIEYTKRSNKWYFPSLYYKKSAQFNGTKIDFLMIDTIELCGNTKDIQNAGFFEMLKNESHDPRGPVNATAAELQWDWIELNMNSSDAQYLIVSGHYPVHSMSSHGPTDCLRQRLIPLLEKYNVNAYFSGHDHTLQHFVYNAENDHKIHYIVSGAASRADAATSHLSQFKKENLLYYYPSSSWFSWSPMSQLGFRKGGITYMEFGHESALFTFHDKKGEKLYGSSIPVRQMPDLTKVKMTQNPMIEI